MKISIEIPNPIPIKNLIPGDCFILPKDKENSVFVVVITYYNNMELSVPNGYSLSVCLNTGELYNHPKDMEVYKVQKLLVSV